MSDESTLNIGGNATAGRDLVGRDVHVTHVTNHFYDRGGGGQLPPNEPKSTMDRNKCFDWSSSNMQNLRELLVETFDEPNDPRQFAKTVGFATSYINLQGTIFSQWHEVLDYARKQGQVIAIIDAAMRDPRGKGKNALLVRARNCDLNEARGPNFSPRTRLDAEHLERITGKQSTFLPVAFFERGTQLARAVVKIVLMDGFSGTGFLIEGNRIITNNHVLENAQAAASAKVLFNYQESIDGLAAPYDAVSLAPQELFKTSKADDWSVVKVAGDMNAKYGKIPIAKLVDVPKQDDFAIIIQHPMGDDKKIGLFRNLVTYADEKIVQYTTDTQKGSSGSPVFNYKWELMALHHAGYIEDYATKQRYATNEGIFINRVVDGIGM